jgi:hypothetical protein
MLDLLDHRTSLQLYPHTGIQIHRINVDQIQKIRIRQPPFTLWPKNATDLIKIIHILTISSL